MLIQSLPVFEKWMKRLKDNQGRAKILGRIRRLREGNPGDHHGVGESIMEMRVNFGPGYRIYYIHRGMSLVLLLCGGDKDSQPTDIQHAKQLASTLGEV